jgi:catechol 2,3-dioxygenase-like lactoylglutathione lyase family enzyme
MCGSVRATVPSRVCPGVRAEVVFAERREHSGRVEVMFKVEDVDAVLAAARDAGAHVADPPSDREYGERQAGLVDPFGHAWVLTQTLRDTDPADWGGGLTVAPRTSTH